mmetsp:Transcript_81084/g.215275  ORF Transcript_81084/g.215275 Transcript_81084/m.215275 type:complete len:236 (-) Transcript_81084:146-853(-)
MELEVAGAAHCSVPHCHQLDFLPFKCDACSAVFCKDHFAYAKHSCPRAGKGSVQVLLCPLCKEAIRIQADEDPNITWERHFTSTCRQAAPQRKGPPRCPVPGCKEQMGLSNRFECQRCGLTVCMRHRMQEDHPCNPPSAAAARSRSQPAPRSAPGSRGWTRGAGQRGGAPSTSDDERLARELQEQELAAAGTAGQQRKKKGVASRVASMFACFKTPQARSHLLGGGGSSSSSSRR